MTPECKQIFTAEFVMMIYFLDMFAGFWMAKSWAK